MATDGIEIVSWLQLIAFGGIAGSLGQMVRVVAGLKKATEEADAKGETLKENYDNGRLIRSLMIGAVAGILAVASTVGVTAGVVEPITREVFLAIVAAGYAGTDFIEAFMTKNLKAVAKSDLIVVAEAEAAAQAAAAKVSADEAAAAAASAVAAQGSVVTPPVTDESVG
jgi:hypothetical protein